MTTRHRAITQSNRNKDSPDSPDEQQMQGEEEVSAPPQALTRRDLKTNQPDDEDEPFEIDENAR